MKLTKKLAVLVLSMAVLPVKAADQPTLNESIKPLARLLGNWEVDPNQSFGNPKYSAQAKAGGSLVVGTFQFIGEGKVTCSFLQCFYWKPECNSIGYNVVFSTGRHLSGSLFVKGNKWVIQGIGSNGKGELESSLLQMDWLDNDTLLLKETHDFVAGELKAESPVSTFKRIKGFSVQASSQPALNENLKPLAKYVGKWTYVWPGEKGEIFNGTTTKTVDPAGAAIVGEGVEMNKDNEIVYSFFHIIHWRPETKSLGELWLDSEGGHSLAVMTTRGDQRVWQRYGYDGKGRFGTSRTTLTFQGDDSFVVQKSCIVEGGEAKPDTRKVLFKRAKD